MHVEEEGKLNSGYVSIGMLSPDRVLELSCGEVKTSDTLNYKNYHPSSEGLFSERIFGPTKDWECRCGKYKKVRYRGVVCENCGVSVTTSAVRRERFGHIELGCNVVLPQYLYGGPSILATILDLPQAYLEQIVFGGYHIDVNEYWEYENKLQAINIPDENVSPEECGTAGILSVLENINLREELLKLDEKLEYSLGYLAQPFLHRKEVLESFIESESRPEWMISSRILVLPPGLRPILEYKGKLYSSEINDRYRIIVNRSKLYDQLLSRKAPEIILHSQRRMIQIAVDALYDSSLEKEEYIKELRESLLSRRHKKIDRVVDYSAKGMVIPERDIDIEKIGIPIDIAKEIFRPFIVRELVDSGFALNIKKAYKMLDEQYQWEVNEVLQNIQGTFVVLVCTNENRILSFKVQVTSDMCFALNPLSYNLLDIGQDDESMHIRVFAQLSDDSAEEAITKFGVKNHIVSEYSEEIQLIPDRYAIEWLSQMSQGISSGNRKFISRGELYCAYENGCLDMNELVDIRNHTSNGFDYMERTTLGRLIINEFLPQEMGVINRSSLKNKYLLEHNYDISSNEVISMCEKVYRLLGPEGYIAFLRKYEGFVSKYCNSINVICEDSLEIKRKKKNARRMFEREFELIRRRISQVKLGDIKGSEEAVKITYKSKKIQQYVFDYLCNRIVAKDVYDYADKIASKGDILNKDLIKQLVDRNIDRIYIYSGEITDGVFSRNAFGKEVSYNPFIVSMMAIDDAICRVDFCDARAFMDVLLASDVLRVDETITSVLSDDIYEGEIGHCFKMIYNTEDYIFDFSKLKKKEIIEIKTFLLYILLKKGNIKISVRLLMLLVNLIMSEAIVNHDGEQLLIASDTIGLGIFGEQAAKSVQIDIDSPVIKRNYGKINLLNRNNNFNKDSDQFEELTDYIDDELIDFIDDDEFDDWDDEEE